MESILPLRALARVAKETADRAAREAAERAAEVFLGRRLFRRRSDGAVMRAEFVALHYPLYWHYDVLHGLKVMTEGGWLGDTRCTEALDLLESKRLPDGGWPAERSYYSFGGQAKSGRELVDWGGTSRRKSNDWVTVDALAVMQAAGRIQV